MSGFLARVAARAVGEAPLARPKLPTLFEGTPAEGLEIVDTEAAAPLSRGRAPQAPVPDSRPIAVTAHRREPAAAVPEAPAARAFVPHAAEPTAEIEPPTRDTSASPLTETPSAVAGPFPAAPAVPAATAVAATTTVRAAGAVPVAPPVLAFGRRPARSQAAVASEPADPPVVRVHIGRLEVRANLQEAPPQRPRRAETAPPGPSLADYLRGRRTAQ